MVPAAEDGFSYPQALAFVVKLHPSSDASKHVLRGRIEHPATCRKGQFETAAELGAWIEHVLAERSRPA